MRDRPSRRRAVVAAWSLLAMLSAVPAALAQTDGGSGEEQGDSAGTDPWAGSGFTTPFRGGDATVTSESFEIAGVFVKRREAVERIVQVDVRFEGEGSGVPDGPPPTGDPGDEVERRPCVPEDPAPFVGEGTTSDEAARYEFSVPAEESVWPCNGRYVVVATAQTNQDVEPYDLSAVLTVAVPPRPVTVVETRYDTSVDAVEVVWEPLTDDELAQDAIGYRVERAGPIDDDGADFVAVGPEFGVDDQPVLLDSPDEGGLYRYRVRSLRAGADGAVPARAEDSAVAEVTVPDRPEPTTSTTTTIRRSTSGVGGGRSGSTSPRRPRPGVFAPPTTVDTGFDETIDYGERSAGEQDTPELAGQEGQSIIRTEGEGAGLLAPAAGALVLLGWAGHVAYLNRLAKQF